MKEKLFIFDVDGTLVNSRAGTIKAIQKTFSHTFNKQVNETDLYPFSGSHFDFIVSEFIGDCSSEELNEASEHYSKLYYNTYSNLVDFFPDVRNTLEELSKKVYLSTATNMSQSGIENLLSMLNVSHLFEKIVGTKNFANAKPNPDILYESMDELGVSAEKTIMVGDSPNDILAGKNARVTTVAMVYGQHTPNLILSYKPDHIFHTFNEVRSLI